MKNIFLISTLLISTIVIAQNNISAAFSESYKNEINEDYVKAIDNMLAINNDESYTVKLRLGWLYYLNGDYNKSTRFYENAIKLESSSIEARFGLVYPLSAMLNWDEVIQIYLDILKIDSNNLITHYRLAYIYFLRKDWLKTEMYLQNILKLFPFDYDSNLLLGSTYLKNGKIKEAKMVLQKALEYNPDSKDVLKLLKGL